MQLKGIGSKSTPIAPRPREQCRYLGIRPDDGGRATESERVFNPGGRGRFSLDSIGLAHWKSGAFTFASSARERALVNGLTRTRPPPPPPPPPPWGQGERRGGGGAVLSLAASMRHKSFDLGLEWA